MKKYFLFGALLLIVCALVNSAVSKDPEFRVLGKKGNVQVQGKEINTGDAINHNDKIVVKSDSYLGLVHTSGRTIEINKAGTYSAASIAKEVSAKASSASSKFANYVVDEISKSDDGLSFKKPKKNLSVVGSVERAEGGEVNVGESIFSMSGTDSKYAGSVNYLADVMFNNDKNFVNICLPRSSYLIDAQTTFSWYKNKDATSYLFKICDRNDVELYSENLSDTSLAINLDKINFKRGENYYWSVSGDNNSRSDQFCINLLSKENASKFQKELSSIVGDNQQKQDAVSKLISAAFYEDVNLMSNAVESYRTALEIAPDVPSYKNLFARYLIRIGLTDEAKRVMK